MKLEHEVLLKLNQESELPFQVPLPVRKDGESLLRLPSHKIGCIYHYMEGDNPVFDTEEMLISFGESAGYLLQALKRLELQQPLIYRPYYELEHAHPNCPIEKVLAWCGNPPIGFKGYKEELAWISSQLIHFKEYIPQLKQLPHQIIHGDLNASNVLAGADNKINAILDFEFTTRDLRIMEVAVCISDLISKGADEQRDVDKVHYFFRGLGRTTNLLPAEIEALPLLIQLRRLDVFLHFLGRYLDGIDDAKVLEEQISSLASYQDWMNGRGQRIAGLWEKVT